MTIAPATTVGPVSLTVSSLDRALSFYGGVLGLSATRHPGGTAVLSGGASTPVVSLTEVASAQPQPRRTTGLYHLAMLVPSRPALARALARLVEARYPLHGASDHLVSEALYLADPDGNGIEIYADRPRDRWPRRDQTVQMASDPLDLEGLLAELSGPGAGAGPPMDPATSIGHVHLRVSDLKQSEAFYHGVLGFDVSQRDYPGALFVAAGGYHHHIGMNTWGGAGAPPPPSESVGLRWFAINVPDGPELKAVLARVRMANIDVRQTDAGWFLRDPSHNGIVLVSGGVMGIAKAASTVSVDTDRAAP